MSHISCLPTELLCEVLHSLPISDLLAFGRTSKYHHALQMVSLSRLQLGVFPTRIDSLLSLTETLDNHDASHRIQRILGKRRARSKDAIIFNQNLTVARILHKYPTSLRDLEVSIWDLQQAAAEALAKLSGLRRLSIKLDHPSSRCTDLHLNFWCESPGSTVWNSFYAGKDEAPVFGRLTSLNLERAGITDYQLLQILEENPMITEIRLRKCLTVTDEFFRDLSRSRVGQQLKVFHFTESDNHRIDRRVLKHISEMPSLQSLSFSGCVNIIPNQVQELNESTWHILDVTLPYSNTPSAVIEIDPAYT